MSKLILFTIITMILITIIIITIIIITIIIYNALSDQIVILQHWKQDIAKFSYFPLRNLSSQIQFIV